MTDTYWGIDVSVFQDPAKPDGVHTYAQLKALGCDFVVVRLTYGTARDSRSAAHYTNARAAGIDVGPYHFFRSSQPVADQVASFCAQALACGVQVGDLCPKIDIEKDGAHGQDVQTSWAPLLSMMASELAAAFGLVEVYETQLGFAQIGKPTDILQLGQWIAHYTSAASPAAPNQLVTKGASPIWNLWQKRVGPFVKNGPGGVYAPDGTPWKPGLPGPGPLDQSVARILQRCTKVPGATGSTPPPPAGDDPDHGHNDLVANRLAALALGGLDLSHSPDDFELYDGGNDEGAK